MRMHACGHQMMVTETSKTMNFCDHFIYNMIINWIAILFIGITFFYRQVFLKRVKATDETTTLLTRFTYNTTLYWLTNLAMGITFLYYQVFFLWKVLHNRTCLFGYAPITNVFVCLFDNWLYKPISVNLQLTLHQTMNPIATCWNEPTWNGFVVICHFIQNWCQ